MWKHKLQEALASAEGLPNTVLEAQKELDKAICFYLGEAEKFQTLADRLHKEQTPALCPSEFRMPYDTCLYEALIKNVDIKYPIRTFSLIYKDINKENLYRVMAFCMKEKSNASLYIANCYGVFGDEYHEMICRDIYSEEIEEQNISSLFVTGCSIAHLVLLFLSCKNITTRTVPAPERLNKKRRKNRQLPICEYKVLEVNPLSGVRYLTKSPSQSSQGLMRVHLCRGHFKEYPPDRPLFGKYSGRFWWQPAVRGEKKRGILNKDYTLKNY